MRLFGKILLWLSILFGGLLVIKLVLLPFMLAGKVIDTGEALLDKTFDADNIIHNYEWFYDVNASYRARVSQIEGHKSLLVDAGDDRRHVQIEIAAMQQTCRELAEKYNANSQKMNRSIFKGWSLPHKLSMAACE